jgi:hypothetical protein
MECTVNTLHRQLLAKRYTAVRHCTAVAQVLSIKTLDWHKCKFVQYEQHTCTIRYEVVLTVTLPGFIVLTISSVIKRGAGLPGISAVPMMMSASFDCVVQCR